MEVSKKQIESDILFKTIRLKDFCEKHDILDVTNIYTNIGSGNIDPRVLVKLPRATRIYESYFIRRKAFYKKIWLQNHDIYYLLHEYFNDTKIQEACERFSGQPLTGYLQHTMFVLPPESILKFRISKSMWSFNKFGRDILRGMKRNYPNFEASYILNKRMRHEQNRLQTA